MAQQSLRGLLNQARHIVSVIQRSSCPLVTRSLLANRQVDAITFDLQHGLIAPDMALHNLINAARASGAFAVVRLANTDHSHVGRCLDLGAQGVIAPMIESVEQAVSFVAASKYAPEGSRSWGPIHDTPSDMHDYTRTCNSSIAVLGMVETAAGLDVATDVLSVPGLDGIFVGPSDLSLSLGVDTESPTLIDAFKHLSYVAVSAGKVFGLHCSNEQLRQLADDCNAPFVTVGTDMSALADGLQAATSAEKTTKRSNRSRPKRDAVSGDELTSSRPVASSSSPSGLPAWPGSGFRSGRSRRQAAVDQALSSPMHRSSASKQSGPESQPISAASSAASTSSSPASALPSADQGTARRAMSHDASSPYDIDADFPRRWTEPSVGLAGMTLPFPTNNGICPRQLDQQTWRDECRAWAEALKEFDSYGDEDEHHHRRQPSMSHSG